MDILDSIGVSKLLGKKVIS